MFTVHFPSVKVSVMNPRIWRPVGRPHVIFEEEHQGGVVRQGLEVFLLVNLKPQLLYVAELCLFWELVSLK